MENDGKNSVKRKKNSVKRNTIGLKPFEKGQSGNPNGRPKDIPEIKEQKKIDKLFDEENEKLLRQLFIDGRYQSSFLRALEVASENGNMKPFEYIRDTLIGKPAERPKPEKETDQEKLSFPFATKPKGVQWEIYEDPSRYIVANIGRQWGKTMTMILKLGQNALIRLGKYWWVAPTYQQSRIAYKRALIIFQKQLIDKNESRLEITLKNNSSISFKSSDNKDNLRGESLDGCVLDEYAMQDKDVYPEIIRPMLTATEGWCYFISTPKSKNHFWELSRIAQKEKNWSYYTFPSYTSPFIKKEEIDNIKRTTPEIIFKQEYLAEFIEDGTTVFRGFRECVKGEFQKPESHKQYVIGADIAKYHDFTVLTVFDVTTKHMVAYDRFNQLEYSYVKQKIRDLSKEYNNAIVYFDSTGVGDPIYEDLSKQINIIPVKFNNAIKNNMIVNLALLIERGEISFPSHEEIIHELSIYTMEMLSSGRVRYNAPDGYHDDIVISMALACSQLAEAGVNLEGLLL